jgi:hypothetical protein
MSTLKVTNIQDTAGGNSSTSEEIYSGRAKAWVNFNGQGTVAIRADFNVNTITDIGSGRYSVNFSSAMPDANFAMVGTPSEGFWTTSVVATSSVTTTSAPFYVSSSTSYYDVSRVNVAIFR